MWVCLIENLSVMLHLDSSALKYWITKPTEISRSLKVATLDVEQQGYQEDSQISER